MSPQSQFKPYKLLILTLLLALLAPTPLRAAAERPHGLEPDDDMPFIPDLGGLRRQPFRNQYGQLRQLSEAVVLRRSALSENAAEVPAGGLYYISEVKDEVRPLRRDPFIILGEHAYLVDLKTSLRTVRDVAVQKGDKKLVDQDGYRLWFDYATDHYDKPYLQLALISPAGHWPLEFAVSTHFTEMRGVRELNLPGAEREYSDVPQIDPYFQDPVYEYGASRFSLAESGYAEARFSSLEYPVIDEATFAMSRPWVMDLRPEDFRIYKGKRIYAFRRPQGFLLRVTDFSGGRVLGEKLVRPITAQTYKDRPENLESYSLTIPEEDLRIEIALEPEFLKNSDFAPWANDVPHGWSDGILSLVVYTDLLTVKRGEPWPLDARYRVGLEANLLTGGLQRLILENAGAFTLDNANDSHYGPEKWSHVWNRPAFKLVANGFGDGAVRNYYVRGQFFERTDNLVFFPDKGRKNIDFFVGSTPTLVSILEDTFLTRLADAAFSTVVEPSHFSSHPRALSNLAFNGPDHGAPFVARLRGFGRTQYTNSLGDKLTAAEGLVIRGSYVDWRRGRVVIPPSGLYYTSRNARNVRVTRGEAFLLFGKKAWLATFDSTTTVRRNFDLDYWKLQPDGALNPIFWQDVPVGVENKMLRFTRLDRLDDRPLATLNIIKYSGNNFGAPFLLAQGLRPEDKAPGKNRHAVHDLYAEGATWVLPEFIGDETMRIGEFGTPSLLALRYTYREPERRLLAVGDKLPLGQLEATLTDLDQERGTVRLSLSGPDGKAPENRTLGPLNAETRAFLPQHQRIVDSLQLVLEDGQSEVMLEMDVQKPFEDDRAAFWLFKDLQKLERNQPLPGDPRFAVRPDVCGHCYQLNELLFDNVEPIILDRDNPRFDGPKGPDGKPLFTLALDSFDGEMIHAWHIEADVRGRVFRSANLAFNPRNNVDCLIGVNGTIEGFLRQSMLERMEYHEYWRLQRHRPVLTGLDAWSARLFQ